MTQADEDENAVLKAALKLLLDTDPRYGHQFVAVTAADGSPAARHRSCDKDVPPASQSPDPYKHFTTTARWRMALDDHLADCA